MILREKQQKLPLSTSKTDKYEYLTGKEKLSSNQS